MDTIRKRTSEFLARQSDPKVWTRPEPPDFLWGKPLQVLDQSLGNCGLVRFEITDDGMIIVWAVMTLRPKIDPEYTSFRASYEKTFWLREQLVGELLPITTVMETPAVGGHRIESSLLAGYAVWDVVRDSQDQPPAMVSKRHVGLVLCNSADASKSEIREAVGWYLPASLASSGGWNQHTRDALAIGLTYLYDLKRGQE